LLIIIRVKKIFLLYNSKSREKKRTNEINGNSGILHRCDKKKIFKNGNEEKIILKKWKKIAIKLMMKRRRKNEKRKFG